MSDTETRDLSRQEVSDVVRYRVRLNKLRNNEPVDIEIGDVILVDEICVPWVHGTWIGEVMPKSGSLHKVRPLLCQDIKWLNYPAFLLIKAVLYSPIAIYLIAQ